MSQIPSNFSYLSLVLALVSACGSNAPQGPSDLTLGPRLENHELVQHVTPRTGYGGLKVRLTTDRMYVLEAQRDSQWNSSRRLVAYTMSGVALWTVNEQPQEHFMDFAVHPSGAITLSVERKDAQQNAYDLVRINSDGQQVHRQILPQPVTVPANEVGDLASPIWQMRSWQVDTLTDGWLRVEAQGDNIVAAFLSLTTPTESRPVADLASGVMSLRWQDNSYTEVWTHILDGRHGAQPVAWTYDEFRWRETPLRALLSLSEDGTIVVGRTWNTLRCQYSVRVRAEFTARDCVLGPVADPIAVEHQPFAVTSFSLAGERSATRIFVPSHANEFVVFDMSVRNQHLALAGTVVRELEDGSSEYYPSVEGGRADMAAYDGYLAVIDYTTGQLQTEQRVNAGRGDYFASVRWTDTGILAVGASDWDRWFGGMSISRGANPLLVYWSLTDNTVYRRTVPFASLDRHFHLLGVDFRNGVLAASGLADAPMTHSGDGQQRANMTFGGLHLLLQ